MSANNQITYIVSVDPTPNHNSYKFCINHSFAGDIMWECDSAESASESELAQEIWNLGNVERVFFHDSMIVVHKTPEANWPDLLDNIRNKIDKHFFDMRPLFRPGNEFSNKEESDERLDLIRQIIVDYIQPGVMMHGGFIRLVKFCENVLYLSMHGACNGCSSADVTLQQGIKRLVNFYFPDVSVELVN